MPKKAPVRPPPVPRAPTRQQRRGRAVPAEVVEPTAIAVREPDGRPPVPSVAPPVLSREQRDILRAWLEAKSPDTVRCYQQWLAAFVRWLRAAGIYNAPGSDGDAVCAMLQLGPAKANWILQRWVNAMVGAGVPRTTYAKHYAAVRSFATTLQQAELVAFVPAAKLPRVERPDAMEAVEKHAGVPAGYRKLVDALETLAKAKGAKPIDVRDWAIARAARGMGLRRIELHRCNAEDVEVEQLFTRVLGKGRRKQVRQPMGPKTAAVLRRWLRVRERAVGSPKGPLFVRLDRKVGERLERGTYNAILTRRCHELGIELTPHDLRRIYSTGMIDRFGLRRAKDMTRHVNVATLEIYDLAAGRDLAKMAAEGEDDD